MNVLLLAAALTAQPMFVGDSITHQSKYLGYVRLYQALHEPCRRVAAINGGLCGDSAANATERWERDVLTFDASEYFVMLGMNDYRNYLYESDTPDEKTREARAAAIARYREKYASLCAQAKATGKRVTLMTPSPQDVYSGAKPLYVGKNEIGLSACASIVREFAAQNGFGLIELHHNMSDFLRRHHAEIDYSPDHCHPAREGGLLLATEIVEQLGLTNAVADIRVQAKDDVVDWLYEPKALPFPDVPEWRRLVAARPKTKALSREMFAVDGLKSTMRYILSADGHEIGRFTGAALARGVDIAELDTPSQRRARAAAETIYAIMDLDNLIQNIHIIDIHYCRSGNVAELDRLLAGKQGESAPFRKWADDWKKHRHEKAALRQRLDGLIDELYAKVKPIGYRLTVVAEPPRPTMLTPWGEKVTNENAWRGYPRPQMVRSNWINLNGEWTYAITAITNTFGRPTRWDGKIRVPFALESPLSGCDGRLLEPHEYLWYTRKIELDPRPGERILLHFGGVDFRAIVYLGHNEIMDVPHESGQLPFTVDLTPYAKKGVNELTVCVWDPTTDFVQSRGKQSPKTWGCFYTRMSGIWQTVWMETVPESHIRDYRVMTDIDKGEARFEVDAVGEGKLSVEVDGVGSAEIDGCSAVVKIADAKLWSPESPNLYSFTMRFGDDEIKGYFGLRKFEKRKDAKGVWRFFLNNEPYYVIGTLDQGWWPDGLLTPPSEDAMAFDIKTLKDCGFNTMRKHIKVEPLRYYALCDKLGLLVLQDMPSSTVDSRDPCKWTATKGYGLYRKELKGMMDLLQKAPSIVMWVPYNEGWGQHDAAMTHTTLDFVKRYDPTRLVNGPSGWMDFEGGQMLCPHKDVRILTDHRPAGECEAADTVDYHYYRGPEMPPVNARRISFLGEFGGLGHPVEGHIWREFAQGVALDDSKQQNWGYGGIDDTKTREGLEATYLGLIDKLGRLAEKGLAGSIYTQTTDVELEINGLLTYDRKILKFDPAVLSEAHRKIRAVADSAATSR